MKPVFSGCKIPIHPSCIYLEEKLWKDLLGSKLDSNYKEKWSSWKDLPDEEKAKYENQAEIIQTEEQLHEYLRFYKEKVYEKCKNKKEIQKLSNMEVKNKKIQKRSKKQ